MLGNDAQTTEHGRQAFARLRTDPIASKTAAKRAINLKNALILANRLHAMFGGQLPQAFICGSSSVSPQTLPVSERNKHQIP